MRGWLKLNRMIHWKALVLLPHTPTHTTECVQRYTRMHTDITMLCKDMQRCYTHLCKSSEERIPLQLSSSSETSGPLYCFRIREQQTDAKDR